ncbi:MAG: GNAT family N-acetyltransferase [Alphaproteobacteria bacterium]|nr:GNAT family N-acetyltransferase [Alphaproteobacteria bacterium]
MGNKVPFVSSVKKFYDLTHDELFDIYQARAEVFVVEQNCVYQDFDEYDKQAYHIMISDGDNLAAYARIIPAGLKYQEHAIGRVLTLSFARGKGVGRILMEACLDCVKRIDNGDIRISAQSYLRKFYESYGFEVVGNEYLEDGIPHLEMLR